MPRSATFYLSDWGGFWGSVNDTSGVNHAGLECDRDTGQPFYVTWNGTIKGADWGASKTRVAKLPGALNAMNMPAHMKIGFSDINKMNWTTNRMEPVPNPLAFTGVNALTPTTDYMVPGRNPGTVVNIPTMRVRIPVRSPGGVVSNGDENLFGLDIDAIWTWWFEILMADPNDPRRQYCKISTMRSTAVNCCGMVGLALLKGGLGDYASSPTNVFYQGSASLLRWINKAVKRIADLNDQRRSIMSSPEYRAIPAFNDGPQAEDFHGYADLPDLASWKRHSAVQESLRTGFARRKEQVAEIDRLLPLYHAARAAAAPTGGTPTIPPVPNGPSWMELLTKIHEQCFQHLVEKPNSDRRQPMLALAKTIHEAIGGNNWYQTELANGITAMPMSTGFVGNYRR